jgi:hypothetical protein
MGMPVNGDKGLHTKAKRQRRHGRALPGNGPVDPTETFEPDFFHKHVFTIDPLNGAQGCG